ncbi:MAG: hypothetical protein ACE5Z5_11610 [Candidatus Bathyarchaeia archaeon]
MDIVNKALGRAFLEVNRVVEVEDFLSDGISFLTSFQQVGSQVGVRVGAGGENFGVFIRERQFTSDLRKIFQDPSFEGLGLKEGEARGRG